MPTPIAILLPYIPQLVTFAIKLGNFILEMAREMTPEEMQLYLDKTYNEIAVEKRLVKDEDGRWVWK